MNIPDKSERQALIAACERLIATEREVSGMDRQSRDWFFGKDGHRDCFRVAHALKRILSLCSDSRAQARLVASYLEREKGYPWR